MVTATNNSGSQIWDLRGKSTDTKPTEGVPNGSTFYEIDGNHDVYAFDGDTNTWIKQ